MSTIVAVGLAISLTVITYQACSLMRTVKDLLVLGELLRDIVNRSSQGQEGERTNM